jgi:hypothetical protein
MVQRTVYQVGNKDNINYTEMQGNKISRFAMLKKQNFYIDIKTPKQNCTNVMQPYGTKKSVSSWK